MSRATSPVTGKPYGLAIVCRVWRLARSGVYRHLTPAPAASPRRRGPTGAMTDAALTVAIRAVLAASPFHGEGHRKVWARLRHAGTRTSLRRVLRLMHENDLLAPSRLGSAHGPRAHDGTIIPETVDMMWGTDLTATFTGEGHAAVFIAVDHCSAECVGIHAHPRATRFEALQILRLHVTPIYATLILLGINLLLAAVFGMMAARSSPTRSSAALKFMGRIFCPRVLQADQPSKSL